MSLKGRVNACLPMSHPSASNGSPDMKTHIENAPCNRPLKECTGCLKEESFSADKVFILYVKHVSEFCLQHVVTLIGLGVLVAHN
jgi:hypothetical protein